MSTSSAAGSEKKYRKDKEVVLELEVQIREIRHGLAEQLRCLDQRLEHHYGMAWELHDFYQRRAALELDYSRSLDKLVKQISTRHKAEKQRREQWAPYSTYKLWQTLLSATTKQSRSHTVLGDAYASLVSNKLLTVMDDMTRVYKKCRVNAISSHDDLIKVINELQSSMKTYHLYHGESRHAESKLQRVESARQRAAGGSVGGSGGAGGEGGDKRGALTKRFRNYEKQTEKHQRRVAEQRLKALKARNEHRLSIDSANAAIRKFFVDDLPELINAMDYGYHMSLGQLMLAGVTLEGEVTRTREEATAWVGSRARELNQRADRQAFLQQYHQIFSLPKKFEFQPHKGDPVTDVSAEKEVSTDLIDRLQTLADRLHSLKLENEELWKTLETTDATLLDRLAVKDFDPIALFNPPAAPAGGDKAAPSTPSPRPPAEIEKLRQERLETEDYYLSKLCQYQSNSNLIARLQAKYQAIDRAISRSSPGGFTRLELENIPRSMSFVSRPARKRPLGKSALETQPKLFGGSIEEYVQVTGQEIPLVIRSCTRIINLYGMHHQGVFRLSGAQHEINEYKNMFERGEEPVLSKFDPKDLNCISGVLKLYFRELREPLFPLQLFDELIACTKFDTTDAEGLQKCITRVQELLLPLPRSIVVVVRYLFAFLNHLTEYSDENMMDAHNLAVCFGPTLVPIPPDHDQVRYQNCVNDLVRILITHQEAIFPSAGGADGGPVYEKCIVEDDGDMEDSLDGLLEDAGVDGTSDDGGISPGVGVGGVEPPLRGVARHDFERRGGSREVSLRRGDEVVLRARLSEDWWEGVVGGQAGLVPHAYIDISKRPGSHKLSAPDELMCTSTESLPLRPSTLSVAPPDPLDRSTSQPNISRGGGSVVGSQPPPLMAPPPLTSTRTFTSSTSSDLSKGGYSSERGGGSSGGVGGRGAAERRGSGSGSVKSSSSKDTLDEESSSIATDVELGGEGPSRVSLPSGAVPFATAPPDLVSTPPAGGPVGGHSAPPQGVTGPPTMKTRTSSFGSGRSSCCDSAESLGGEKPRVTPPPRMTPPLGMTPPRGVTPERIDGPMENASVKSTQAIGSPAGAGVISMETTKDSPIHTNGPAPSADNAQSASSTGLRAPSPALPLVSQLLSHAPSARPTELIGRSASPALTTAEVFAKPNQGTIKKGAAREITPPSSFNETLLMPVGATDPPVSPRSPSLPEYHPRPAFSAPHSPPDLIRHSFGRPAASFPPVELPSPPPPSPPPQNLCSSFASGLPPALTGSSLASEFPPIPDGMSRNFQEREEAEGFEPTVFPPPPPQLCIETDVTNLGKTENNVPAALPDSFSSVSAPATPVNFTTTAKFSASLSLTGFASSSEKFSGEASLSRAGPGVFPSGGSVMGSPPASGCDESFTDTLDEIDKTLADFRGSLSSTQAPQGAASGPEGAPDAPAAVNIGVSSDVIGAQVVQSAQPMGRASPVNPASSPANQKAPVAMGVATATASEPKRSEAVPRLLAPLYTAFSGGVVDKAKGPQGVASPPEGLPSPSDKPKSKPPPVMKKPSRP